MRKVFLLSIQEVALNSLTPSLLKIPLSRRSSPQKERRDGYRHNEKLELLLLLFSLSLRYGDGLSLGKENKNLGKRIQQIIKG